MQYSENIRCLRKANGITQDDLAKKLGVSAQSISKWETGSSEPSFKIIKELCGIFSVTSDYLLGIAEKVEHRCDPTEENALATTSFSNAEVYILRHMVRDFVEKKNLQQSEFSGEERAEIREFVSLVRGYNDFVLRRKTALERQEKEGAAHAAR